MTAPARRSPAPYHGDLVLPDSSIHPKSPALVCYAAPDEYRSYRDSVARISERLINDFARVLLGEPVPITVNAMHSTFGGDGDKGHSVSGPRAWVLDLGKRTLYFTESDWRAALIMLDAEQPGQGSLLREWLAAAVDLSRVVLKKYDDTLVMDFYDFLLAYDEDPTIIDGAMLRRVKTVRTRLPRLFDRGRPTQYGVMFNRFLEIAIALQPNAKELMKSATGT